MTTERDIHNQIRYAEKKGMEKQAVETARHMIAKSFSTEDIIECTGLSEEQVRALR
jgi:hypothetical protein